MPLRRSTLSSQLLVIGELCVLNSWHARLSLALQKRRAACLLQAGRVRGAADLAGESGWDEDVEDLLRDAAATAGVGGLAF